MTHDGQLHSPSDGSVPEGLRWDALSRFTKGLIEDPSEGVIRWSYSKGPNCRGNCQGTLAARIETWRTLKSNPRPYRSVWRQASVEARGRENGSSIYSDDGGFEDYKCTTTSCLCRSAAMPCALYR